MSLIGNFLARTGLVERRRDPRIDAKGLTASFAAGSEQKKVRIGNISPTGLYLVTEDRWNPGTPVVLTLGEKSIFEVGNRIQVKLWTRCVRVDENGVGLAFAHSHVDRAKWLEAMSMAPSLIGENHPVQVFRFTRALAFLFHIAPAAEGEILKLIRETLTIERAERAIDLALQADDLLESRSCVSRTDVSTSLVLRILEWAVMVEEAEAKECWARLLAAAALSDWQEEQILEFAGLLSKLNQLHLRVLAAAWREANRASWNAAVTSFDGAYRSVEEVGAFADIAPAEGIEWIVNDLHEFGLLGNMAKPALGGRRAEVNLALSELGLRFCEPCLGQPEPAQNDGRNLAAAVQYLPLDNEATLPASVREGLSDSLASEAQAIRESSSVAVLD